jgi:hypothetical protein
LKFDIREQNNQPLSSGEQKVNDGSCARNESSMNISDFSALQKHFQA